MQTHIEFLKNKYIEANLRIASLKRDIGSGNPRIHSMTDLVTYQTYALSLSNVLRWEMTYDEHEQFLKDALDLGEK